VYVSTGHARRPLATTQYVSGSNELPVAGAHTWPGVQFPAGGVEGVAQSWAFAIHGARSIVTLASGAHAPPPGSDVPMTTWTPPPQLVSNAVHAAPIGTSGTLQGFVHALSLKSFAMGGEHVLAVVSQVHVHAAGEGTGAANPSNASTG
jgi:hypothetical protein